MITIKVLTAEPNKVYTNGKISGTVIWVPENEIQEWYQIDNGTTSYLDKFKSKFDEEEEIEE
nr:MAG TPA: hypothetical protein [Bacteriophage sp.]